MSQDGMFQKCFLVKYIFIKIFSFVFLATYERNVTLTAFIKEFVIYLSYFMELY